MKSKILFTASIAKHILRFHLPYLKWFQENGYETHVACSGEEDIPYCDKKIHTPFVRSPYSLGHIKAYKELKKTINDNTYDIIHCHTPMASIVTRLASAKTRKKGTKVLYTGHGFHFFKGAPLLNWLTFYPIELFCSHYCDAIITINQEDFDRIKRRGSRKTAYYKIPGIGIDKNKFKPISLEKKQELRTQKGYKSDDYLLVYAAEFIPRKNHEFLIKLATELHEKIPKIKILFCGRGHLNERLTQMANQYNVTEVIHFLGFRTDINEIFQMSDIGISASKQEGLGLNLAEEMMCGLPVVASLDRGHKEIVTHKKNGFLYAQENKKEFLDFVYKIYSNKELQLQLNEFALKSSQRFSLENSLESMADIYTKYMTKNI